MTAAPWALTRTEMLSAPLTVISTSAVRPPGWPVSSTAVYRSPLRSSWRARVARYHSPAAGSAVVRPRRPRLPARLDLEADRRGRFQDAE